MYFLARQMAHIDSQGVVVHYTVKGGSVCHHGVIFVVVNQARLLPVFPYPSTWLSTSS